ncbi:MAG: Ppx/GppA family phosphatase [Anaerolineae bacterium]|nr:Ppx/GppA family phosphatase [Anaerolineae bacterium]
MQAKWTYEPAGTRHLGIIDLGSNTARLVIFGYVPGQYFRIEDVVRERVRLSEGMGESGVLRAEPIKRALATLKLFKLHCDTEGVADIICVATAATRDAENGASFLARVQAETGLTPRILSGEEEAYYGYLAAVNSLTFGDGVVIDIGGGSVEITQVAERRLLRGQSLPLGAVRLTERFLKSDPVKKGEFNALVDYLRAQLGQVEGLGGAALVGMGGTIRALAKMDRASQNRPDHLHGHRLTRATVDRLVDQVRALPVARRSNLTGLSADRADVILGGAVGLQTIMALGGFDACTVSNQGIREGLFYERFLAPADPPLLDDIREFGVQNVMRLYGGNRGHFQRTRDLALSLFDQLTELHGYGQFERDVLGAAAWLHDVGVSVDYWEHHLHSAYIILNVPLPGWSPREIALIALLARNHRKGGISLEGLEGALEAGDADRVEQLASLLRLAEYLERGKTGVVEAVRVHQGSDWVQIEALTNGDASIEIWEANRNADLFHKAFARTVEIVEGVA